MAAAVVSLAVGAAAGWLAKVLAEKRKGKPQADFEMLEQLATGKHEVRTCSPLLGLLRSLGPAVPVMET